MPQNETKLPAKTLFLGDGQMLFWNHNGKYYALRVETDTEPDNPRDPDMNENIAKLFCSHRRYSLGDYSDDRNMTLGRFLAKLVKDHVPTEKIAKMLRMEEVPGFEPQDEDNDMSDVELVEDFLDDMDEDLMGASAETAAKALLDGYAIIMPLWLYDHSGITMSVGERVYPYNDRWDSGWVGVAVITREDALTRIMGYEKPEDAPEDIDWQSAAEECIKAEVKTYDQYLRGEVYWYCLYERDTEPYEHEFNDSCWNEIDSCSGFFGDDAIASGMLDNAGNGALEAVQNDAYSTGTAEKQYMIRYEFHMN